MTGQTCVNYANTTEQQLWRTATTKRLYHSDLYKNESVQRYLQQLMEEYRDLSKKLEHVYLSESDRKVLLKRQSELLPLANVFKDVEAALKDLEELLSLLHGELLSYLSVIDMV